MRVLHKIALPFLCAAVAGCVAHGSLRKDLYPTEPIVQKTAARVVLVRHPGPPETLHHQELPWASSDVDLEGYPEAVAAMLGSLYDQVSVTTSAAQAQGANFIVLMGTNYPKTVSLTFQDASGALLAGFSQPGWKVPTSPEADSTLIKIIAPPAMVVSMGTIALGFYYRAHEANELIRDKLSAATAKALSELRRQIAATPILMRGAIPTTEPIPASASCSKPTSSNQAPPVAKEFFARGQSYLGVAKLVEDYGVAAAELEKALAFAPCWASARLSCALAQEGAHQWKRAANHLRAYLDLNGDVPEAAKLHARISELETRSGEQK